jgi:hypothetical protein
MSLLCALPSCIPTVGADPLIITVARDGSDEPACLEGKIACNTFEYAASNVNGNGSDVTMVITYPQKLSPWEFIKLNVNNLKLVGQVENGYTLLCSFDNQPLDLKGWSIYSESAKQLLLENVQVHCMYSLSIFIIDSVSLTGFIGQVLSLSSIKTVHIEDSTFNIDGNPFTFEPIISIEIRNDLTSFTIKNSSLTNKELNRIPLLVDFMGASDRDVSILIENTNFTLTRPPPPNQQAPILLRFNRYNSSKTSFSVNFTISKCNFFNFNSTVLEVGINMPITVEDNIYLNILDSKFHVPQYTESGMNSVAVLPGWGTQSNVHIVTRVDGNTFIDIPSD